VNAVTTDEAGLASFAAANQAWFEDTASAVQRLLKNVAAYGVSRLSTRFRTTRGFVATALMEHHNLPRWGSDRPDLS
jgi:hypothetical protein